MKAFLESDKQAKNFLNLKEYNMEVLQTVSLQDALESLQGVQINGIYLTINNESSSIVFIVNKMDFQGNQIIFIGKDNTSYININLKNLQSTATYERSGSDYIVLQRKDADIKYEIEIG